ncbi:MAG: ribosome biogenesis GTP-binding protein YihA/YsxC [Cytophagales bacterium]|nr:ribosome biogenesis GTP-binding protein YihA/YsxC [Cytophagales bacterium]
MKIKEAIFVASSVAYEKCPNNEKPAFALIGRSNVGKSSLINMLLDRKNLAKTSNKPGKTQLINYFLVNNQWYLVDLPGYGWAQVSKEKRKQWKKMITDYLLYRENLLCVFVLVDARLTPQKIDIEFINWLGKNQVPFVIILTKVDKQPQQKTQANFATFKKALLNYWEELPKFFETSSRDKTGREEFLNYIESIIHQNKS